MGVALSLRDANWSAMALTLPVAVPTRTPIARVRPDFTFQSDLAEHERFEPIDIVFLLACFDRARTH